jgi:hypothetical protein
MESVGLASAVGPLRSLSVGRRADANSGQRFSRSCGNEKRYMSRRSVPCRSVPATESGRWVDHGNRASLDVPDRTQLLCWLTLTLLRNRQELGRWPSLDYRQAALSGWLSSHHRSADWLETAWLSWLAADLAAEQGWILKTSVGRSEMALIAASGIYDYQRPVLQAFHRRCELEISTRRWRPGQSLARILAGVRLHRGSVS